MDLSREPILALARSPRAGAPVVLARGRLLSAVLLVFAATCLSALGAVRVSSETYIDDLFLGATRHPLVTAMLETLGTERTAVVIYLVQRSFEALVVALVLFYLVPLILIVGAAVSIIIAAVVLGYF